MFFLTLFTTYVLYNIFFTSRFFIYILYNIFFTSRFFIYILYNIFSFAINIAKIVCYVRIFRLFCSPFVHVFAKNITNLASFCALNSYFCFLFFIKRLNQSIYILQFTFPLNLDRFFLDFESDLKLMKNFLKSNDLHSI